MLCHNQGIALLPDYLLMCYALREMLGLPIRETRIETLGVSYDFRHTESRTAGA